MQRQKREPFTIRNKGQSLLEPVDISDDLVWGGGRFKLPRVLSSDEVLGI